MTGCEIKRQTKETDITVRLDPLSREVNVNTGCGFFDHMLTLLGSHSRTGLYIKAEGDLEVDCHHTVEDVGIALGQALRQSLGDRRGIRRYGSCTLPMDEVLVTVALDFSGRALLCHDLSFSSPRVGSFDSEACEEFLRALSREAGLTLHVMLLRGGNTHHVIEAVFKALGRAIREAVSEDSAYAGEIPSTKGLL